MALSLKTAPGLERFRYSVVDWANVDLGAVDENIGRLASRQYCQELR